MSDRQLIADLLSALEYHTEQTRPIEFSRVAIEAAREYLRKPAQPSKPWVGLTENEIDALYEAHHNQYGECETPGFKYERAIEAKLREKNALPYKPLTDEMEKQMLRHLGPHRRSAFRDGWRSAEIAHGITKENT